MKITVLKLGNIFRKQSILCGGFLVRNQGYIKYIDYSPRGGSREASILLLLLINPKPILLFLNTQEPLFSIRMA